MDSNALRNDLLIRRTLNFQANETQELEELKKSKEQAEARLNIQISSLNENLTAARTEAEKCQQQTKETETKLAVAEKRNDDLKGDIAGEWHMVNLQFITEDADRLKPFSKSEILFVYLLSFGSNCSK